MSSLHGSPARATWLWLLLIAGTLLTLAIGEEGAAGIGIVALLAVISQIKGSVIILDYMALRHAPLLWRIVVPGWMIAVWSLIAIAYWSGLPR
ncbi:MAG: cytochrome C oxidase subunit IV family protein [Betaproteobacteria bacterium]|nr:cytochrome C oxidase subunit IV family protein [Betaproteobacteria bacterium]